eukprot:2445618-Prymnesium_polylepis.2
MLTDGDADVRAAPSTTLVVLDDLTAKDGRHAVKGKGRADEGGGRGRDQDSKDSHRARPRAIGGATAPARAADG